MLTLVDSGATHNFVKEEAAKNFNLKVELRKNMFKVVNLEMERVEGVARQVSLKLGEWVGMTNFTIIPLDDFDVVLGQEFLKQRRQLLCPISIVWHFLRENILSIFLL